MPRLPVGFVSFLARFPRKYFEMKNSKPDPCAQEALPFSRGALVFFAWVSLLSRVVEIFFSAVYTPMMDSFSKDDFNCLLTVRLNILFKRSEPLKIVEGPFKKHVKEH